MTPQVRQLLDILQDHREAVLSDALAQMADTDDAAGRAALRGEMAELLAALPAAVRSQASSGADATDGAAMQALDQMLRNASQVRAARGLDPESSVRLVQAVQDALLRQLLTPSDGVAAQQDGAAQARLASVRLLHGLMDRCVTTLVSQFVATRESVIRSQAQSLLDMSTPVITLWDQVLLLPLVGVVDSVRAVQVAERLLLEIGRTEAEVTLIDVTGVPVMDTGVARHLLRTVAAAEMLGTRVIFTGISATTAQTMVKLGIDLSSVPTRGSLKAGVALAMSLTGRRVVDDPAPAASAAERGV